MKVFLKYNKTGPSALLCLHYWLELFAEYEVFINCDLFNVSKDPVPAELLRLISGRNVKVINSDYSTGNLYASQFKSKKRCMASANLTCWNYFNKSDDYFWVIDADDTMFLSKDFNLIRTKIKSAEAYAKQENLDGFSLNFYREFNDTWTFGVCLLKVNSPWQRIKEISAEELVQNNLPLNCDCLFDMLGRKGILKLKNFIFDNCGFQHLENKIYRSLPNGIYFWRDRKIWNTPIKPDVISL